MEKIICLILLLTVTTVGIFAQSVPKVSAKETIERRSPAERAQATTDKINAAVQLSPDQYSKILDVIKKYRSANPNSDVKGQKDAMDNRIKAILTRTQWEQLRNSKVSIR